MMVYIIIYADLSKNLLAQVFYDGNKNHFVCTRLCHVIIVGIATLPLVLKRQLEEIKILSIILIICLTTFIVMMFEQLLLDEKIYNHD